MSLTNEAAWLDCVINALKVRPAKVGIPGPGEVLVKNYAIAINPIDWARQALGIFVKQWPAILGVDLAGEVVEIGPGVTDLSIGQRVLAHALGLVSGNPENSSFQKYTVVPALTTCPIPDNMTYEAASVVPLSLSTAALGLYQSDYLALPLPNTSPPQNGGSIIIWGGSSSVGSSAIQLAVASGLDVITTSSEKNFEYCKRLGAKEVFDYSSPKTVDNMIASLQRCNLVGAYDAIGLPETIQMIAQVLLRYGGGFIASVREPPRDIPATVNVKQVFGFSILEAPGGLCKAIYKEFLPEALVVGQFKPGPRPEVIGKGLKQLQAGIDKLEESISAAKVVVVL